MTVRRYLFHAHHGGGWTLAGKVHRASVQAGTTTEPNGWWATARDTVTLTNRAAYVDRSTRLAAHGQTRLAPLAASARLARFVLVAENDATQRANWYKRVDAGVWSWFTHTDHPATEVCSDLEMTRNCSSAKILGSPSTATDFGGMSLSHHGYSSPGLLHLRMASDQGPAGGAICSNTTNNDNNAWNDDALDGHWGNGLEIWLR